AHLSERNTSLADAAAFAARERLEAGRIHDSEPAVLRANALGRRPIVAARDFVLLLTVPAAAHARGPAEAADHARPRRTAVFTRRDATRFGPRLITNVGDVAVANVVVVLALVGERIASRRHDREREKDRRENHEAPESRKPHSRRMTQRVCPSPHR